MLIGCDIMTTCLCETVALLGAYVVGALPTGPLIARLQGITDLHTRGSGNTGATNIGRILGAPSFLIVLLIDAGKAYGYLAAMSWWGISYPWLPACAAALLAGNCYSVFLAGKGGKGVATSLGILAFLAPVWLGIIVGIWLISFLLVRQVGVASSIAALFLAGISLYHLNDSVDLAIFMLCLSALILARHRSNIKAYFGRLL
jgi:acyl phosphate:glycerol-3-phosphate acyltransferase